MSKNNAVKPVKSAMGLKELDEAATDQILSLQQGKGDASVANAIFAGGRLKVSIIKLAVSLHKMGIQQNVLALPVSDSK